MIGMIRARELHGQYPGLRFPVDMERLASAVGCICITWPLLEPVREVKQGRWIGIADWLDYRERRRCIAHAVGHHLLHCGNQLRFQGWQRLNRHKQERECEEFAAHFLIPAQELDKLIGWEFAEIASYFGVPDDLLWRRLTQFATEAELQRWQNRAEEL